MAIKVKGCTVIDDIKNITAGVSTVTTGCVTGTLTAGTVNGGVVCATSCFSGDGSALSNIPSAAITGLSAGGIKVCTYTSPGTFSVPPGTTTLKITATGGGENGCSGSQPIFNGCIFPGPGGDSALTHVKYLTVPPACSSYPVTVGGAGGNTIFGGPTVFLANGAPDPAVTGKPAQADYVLSTNTVCNVVNTNTVDTTHGIPSLYGKGGCAGSPFPQVPGCPACPGAYGAGGGGVTGSFPPSPSAWIVPAGSGAPGFVIVEW